MAAAEKHPDLLYLPTVVYYPEDICLCYVFHAGLCRDRTKVVVWSMPSHKWDSVRTMTRIHVTTPFTDNVDISIIQDVL